MDPVQVAAFDQYHHCGDAAAGGFDNERAGDVIDVEWKAKDKDYTGVAAGCCAKCEAMFDDHKFWDQDSKSLLDMEGTEYKKSSKAFLEKIYSEGLDCCDWGAGDGATFWDKTGLVLIALVLVWCCCGSGFLAVLATPQAGLHSVSVCYGLFQLILGIVSKLMIDVMMS